MKNNRTIFIYGMVSICLINQQNDGKRIEYIIDIITNLPKRLAMMPPLKPPSIPPMAKIDTANE